MGGIEAPCSKLQSERSLLDPDDTEEENHMEAMNKFVQRDEYARHIGVEILDYGRGTARARMKIGRQHRNSAGMVHGGAIFSLADAVFSIASNSHGTLAVAINVSISFF
jgi:acyl-CoA thioesterase